MVKAPKFTGKRAGELWLVSKDGKPVVGISSKAGATKRAKLLQKAADERTADTRRSRGLSGAAGEWRND